MGKYPRVKSLHPPQCLRQCLLIACAGCLLLTGCPRPPRTADTSLDQAAAQTSELKGVILFRLAYPPPMAVPDNGLKTWSGALDLRSGQVTPLADSLLLADSKGDWLLGSAHGHRWLATARGVRDYPAPPYWTRGVSIKRLSPAAVHADGLVGGTLRVLQKGQYDFWTLDVKKGKWKNHVWPNSGAWAFGSKTGQVYVERGSRIYESKFSDSEQKWGKAIGRGYHPVASPTGDLAFVSPSRKLLVVITAAGRRRIYPVEGTPAKHVQWSPDGKWLLYKHSRDSIKELYPAMRRIREQLESDPQFRTAPRRRREELGRRLRQELGPPAVFRVVELATGRDQPLPTGDCDDFGFAASAQWVAKLPDSLVDNFRKGEKLAEAHPRELDAPRATCATCRRLAEAFLAALGMSEVKLRNPRSGWRGDDAMQTDETIGPVSFALGVPGASAKGKIRIDHRHHFTEGVKFPQMARPPSLKLVRWSSLLQRSRDVADRVVALLGSDFGVKMQRSSANRPKERVTFLYAPVLLAANRVVQMPGRIHIELRAADGGLCEVWTRHLQRALELRSVAPTASACGKGLQSAASAMNMKPQELVINPVVEYYEPDDSEVEAEGFWHTVVVTKADGTGLHGSGRKWAQVEFHGGNDVRVKPKHISYKGDESWINKSVSATRDLLAELERKQSNGKELSLWYYPGGRYPVWTPDGKGLLFVSFASERGQRAGHKFADVMHIDLTTRRVTCVVPHWVGRACSEIALAGWKLVMPLGKSRVDLLDLRTGHLSRHGGLPASTTRPGMAPPFFGVPSVSPDGNFVAVLRKLGSGLNCELWVGRLPQEDGAEARCRRVCKASYSVLPVFSRDGRTLYFCRDRATARPSIVHVDVFQIDPTAPEETNVQKVATTIHHPDSLHPMPDGRIAVKWQHGLVLLKSGDDNVEEIKLRNYADPSFPGCQANGDPGLGISSLALSPDGQKLALGMWGKMSDGASVDGIYVCNLDGSEVHRITPLAKMEVEEFMFPDSGKSALELALDIVHGSKAR